MDTDANADSSQARVGIKNYEISLNFFIFFSRLHTYIN